MYQQQQTSGLLAKLQFLIQVGTGINRNQIPYPMQHMKVYTIIYQQKEGKQTNRSEVVTFLGNLQFHRYDTKYVISLKLQFPKKSYNLRSIRLFALFLLIYSTQSLTYALGEAFIVIIPSHCIFVVVDLQFSLKINLIRISCQILTNKNLTFFVRNKDLTNMELYKNKEQLLNCSFNFAAIVDQSKNSTHTICL